MKFTTGATAFNTLSFILEIEAIGNRSLGPVDVTVSIFGGDTSMPSGLRYSIGPADLVTRLLAFIAMNLILLILIILILLGGGGGYYYGGPYVGGGLGGLLLLILIIWLLVGRRRV